MVATFALVCESIARISGLIQQKNVFQFSKGDRTVGHKFSLVLNREITDEELETLRESGCADAVFGTDELPANPEITVTKMDFDDTVSASLGEAIESAFKAVEKVSDLSVPCLTVPPQDEDELAEPAESVG